MPLKWTEPSTPDGEVSFYDHVVADTPLGPIVIEWKSWDDYDCPCARMPWSEVEIVGGPTLDAAKLNVQAAWDQMVARMLPLTDANG